MGGVDMIKSIIDGFLLFSQALGIILIAPLIMGWIKQIKCWTQNRTAPSIFLPYYSLYKLFIKQPVLADNASWLFRLAPYVYFSCLATVCFALPFIATATFSLQLIDVIVLIGLLALARISLALAAMDIGTAFGSLGARRDMFVACLTEPVLLVTFLNVVLIAHSPYLNQISFYFITHIQLYPSLIFSLAALALVLLAETGRIPIDNPATHLELTMIHEAMLLEYSGRYLALLEWGNAIKFVLYAGFMIALFFPFGFSINNTLSSFCIGALTTLLKLFFLAALIGFIESINSKLRLFKITDYLAGAFMLAVLGVLITQLLGGMR